MKKYKILICLLLILSLVFGSVGSAYANPVVGAVGCEGYLLIGSALVSLGFISEEEWEANSAGVMKIARDVYDKLEPVDKTALDIVAKGGMAVSALGMAKFEIPDDLFSNIRSKFYEITGLSASNLSVSYSKNPVNSLGCRDYVSALSPYMSATDALRIESAINSKLSSISAKYKIVIAYPFYKGVAVYYGDTKPSLTYSDGQFMIMGTYIASHLDEYGNVYVWKNPIAGGSHNYVGVQVSGGKVVTGQSPILYNNYDVTFGAPVNMVLPANSVYMKPIPLKATSSVLNKFDGLSNTTGRESVCVNVPANLDPTNSSVVTQSISADILIKGLKSILDVFKGGQVINVGSNTIGSLQDLAFNPSLPLEGTGATTIPDVATGTGTVANTYDLIKDFFNPKDFKLDWSPLKIGLTKVFPFCIPFDFSRMISVFSATPTDFKFNIDLDTMYFKVHHTVDLTSFRLPIMFFRYVVIIMFSYILISRTRTFMKW